MYKGKKFWKKKEKTKKEEKFGSHVATFRVNSSETLSTDNNRNQKQKKYDGMLYWGLKILLLLLLLH